MQSSNLKSLSPRMSLRLKAVMQVMVGGMVFLQIVIFSPDVVDSQNVGSESRIERESLMSDVMRDGPRMAPGIPEGRIPEYSIEGFSYLSVDGTQKLWKLNSSRAFLYNREGIVHTREVVANLYDDANQITRVTGKEGKYSGQKGDLEIFGDVKTVFPDGFVMESQYMKYQVRGREVTVPDTHRVHGYGKVSTKENLTFDGFGFFLPLGGSEILLKRDVVTRVDDTENGQTVIRSDHSRYSRKRLQAIFTMSQNRPPAQAFVKMTQPDLYVQSRTLTFNFGKRNTLQYVTAKDDVTIQEMRKSSTLKYATCGKADFNSKRNIVVLTELPQVYQGSDTITGEKITLHRDRDLVEVDYSNAFSRGRQK